MEGALLSSSLSLLSSTLLRSARGGCGGLKGNGSISLRHLGSSSGSNELTLPTQQRFVARLLLLRRMEVAITRS